MLYYYILYNQIIITNALMSKQNLMSYLFKVKPVETILYSGYSLMYRIAMYHILYGHKCFKSQSTK